VVPDVHAPTSPGCLNEIASFTTNDEFNIGFPFRGHGEMPIVGFPERGIIGGHTYTNLYSYV
jgi:hypothetical protein